MLMLLYCFYCFSSVRNVHSILPTLHLHTPSSIYFTFCSKDIPISHVCTRYKVLYSTRENLMCLCAIKWMSAFCWLVSSDLLVGIVAPVGAHVFQRTQHHHLNGKVDSSGGLATIACAAGISLLFL